jgi:hypothetical protein
MHGNLTPALTAIVNGHGALVLIPDLSYRVTDNLVLSSRHVNIHTFGSENNGFYGPGFVRDRDQIWPRASFQVN